MNSPAADEPLFDAFPPVTTEEWEDRILRDLDGADYGETLLWHTPDGLTLRPYYRADDLAGLAHLEGERPTVELRSSWAIRQTISAGSPAEAAGYLREAVEGGVECVALKLRARDGRLMGVPVRSQGDFAALFEHVPLADVAVHLDAGLQSPLLLAMLANEADRRSIPLDDLRGSLGFDPLSEGASTGEVAAAAFDAAARWIEELRAIPSFSLLEAGSHVFHEAGATVIQETALLMAAVSEYLVRMVERGAAVADVLDRLHLSVSVSTSYLQEIARLRALRLLVPQVVEGFHSDESPRNLPIHAVTSLRSMTLYDSESNLLRATTEAASAVVGGCDVLDVRPMNEVLGEPNAFTLRVARNLQHLLRSEAHLGRVNDPGGGSYYLEVLTDAVARRAWQMFKDIEGEGGLLAALDSGYVHDQLDVSRAGLAENVATRRRVIVGTNHFPDPSEKRGTLPSLEVNEIDEQPLPETADFASLRRHFEEGGSIGILPWERTPIAGPLPAYREAEPVEAVRLETERRTGPVSVIILPIGPPALRTAKANFAANFLGCGGLASRVLTGFATTEEAAAAAPERPPEPADVVVLAASDDAYRPEAIVELTRAYPGRIVGIVAQPGVSEEADFLLYRGADLVATLRHVQELLANRTPA